MNFKDRLREEIEYKGLLIKEISAKLGISNSTFLSYIDARGVLPNVETAVKIASVLNVSVEYLVTGKDPIYNLKHKDIRDITHDLMQLTPSQLRTLKTMIHALV